MLATMFLAPIASLVGSIQQLLLLDGGIDRLQDVLQATPESQSAAMDVALPAGVIPCPPIALDRVSFAYGPYSPPVLKEISLTVLLGQKVAIVGATGSGKTTLAKLLL